MGAFLAALFGSIGSLLLHPVLLIAAGGFGWFAGTVRMSIIWGVLCGYMVVGISQCARHGNQPPALSLLLAALMTGAAIAVVLHVAARRVSDRWR